ncbi:xylose isomerase-like protein [Lineolata rhizophorae]|uniref:Xylose isomerase-like protein n=1 Tax=Lineolata rhizophorae TaxID=578093 RepID=A0A6A6P839_9PEZI|nr:xylose isomerase-like protein [Lineolata rhizophorae]
MAILSMSVGRATVHDIETKLDALAANNFQGVELFYEDLEALASKQDGGLTDDNRMKAARMIRRLCDERSIQIIALQPFGFYEGLLDRNTHEEHILKLKLWFRFVKILGTDTIEIPSQFLREGVSGDEELIISDLRKLADLGRQEMPPVRFAYEHMAWGTFVDTWEKAWNIVQKVDRSNFGILLDTFQIGASLCADPVATEVIAKDADTILDDSLNRLVNTVDPRKVVYIQVGDAEKPARPLIKGHEWYVDGQPAMMSWARAARSFPNDTVGGCLPVARITKALTHGLGFTGWMSCEVFSRRLMNPSPDVPADAANRAAAGWKKLIEDLRLEDVRFRI